VISIGPQTNRPCIVTFSESESARVRAFIRRVGSVSGARARLGIAESTLDAARDCGRVQRVTREKVLERLSEAESCI
jgi:hypothetical protein